MSDEHKFNYVIGRPWDEVDEQNLAIYSLHGEIQTGTQADAEHMLAYAKRQNPHRAYCIYRVTFTKMEVA